jgi:Protein of unknown function (DUF3987)/Bifunctional DNA primase/polymerase, N-terminal
LSFHDDWGREMMDVSNPTPNGATLAEWQTAFAFAPDCLIPLNGKKPLFSEWQNHRSSDTDFQRWSTKAGLNIGIICRQVIAIDVDVLDPIEASKIKQMIVDAALLGACRGRADSSKFLVPVALTDNVTLTKRVVKTATSGGKVELLALGQQFAAYGTHPDGERYQWDGEIGSSVQATSEQVAAFFDQLETKFGNGSTSQLKAKRIGAPSPMGAVDPVAIFLRQSDWFKSEGTNGKVHIVCPFESEHTTDSGQTDTTYFVAGSGSFETSNGTQSFERGHFKCLHSHCEGRTDDDFKNAIGFRESVQGTFDQTQWPEPTPLPDALPPVMPFDSGLLPKVLSDFVLDAAERMCGPPEFIAVPLVVALSSLIAARAVLRPKAHDDWQVVPNLWGALVGKPSSMKSPSISAALKPLNNLAAAQGAVHDEALKRFVDDDKFYKLQIDAANKKAVKALDKDEPEAARKLISSIEAPAKPIERRFIVNDSTVEQLAVILQSNPFGLLTYRDELYGLLCSMDKQGQEGARGFYLQSFDGNQGYNVDRISRERVTLKRLCLSLLGGIQPGRLHELVRGAVQGGSSDDGLLQRFGLMVWPDPIPVFTLVDRPPNEFASNALNEVFERLAKLESNEDMPIVWRFDVAAQATFNEWLVAHETRLRQGDLHAALESHLSKYKKLVPALALIFALVTKTCDSKKQVGQPELLLAIEWAKYLETHAERVYSAAKVPDVGTAATLLKKIAAGKLTKDGERAKCFAVREVAQKNWTSLSNVESVKRAASVLVEYGWLQLESTKPTSTGGRPSERYFIHPDLLA